MRTGGNGALVVLPGVLERRESNSHGIAPGASRFAPDPHYGRNKTGYIGLQDHGDWVAYRNIKIRVLP